MMNKFPIALVSLLVLLVAKSALAINTLHLLALVPLNNAPSGDLPCIDRGEELLPAARLAADVANTNILRNTEFQLEIVPTQTASCTEDSFSLALANFVAELTSSSHTVVGAVGMMCSSTVLSVSPLASLQGIDILQITSGIASPRSIQSARPGQINSDTFERLYQTAPPSSAFNDVINEFITENSSKVERIAVIRHIGTFFIEHDIIVNDFRQRELVNITDFEIPNAVRPQALNPVIPQILDTIVSNDDGLRIIYASVTVEEARELLCEAINISRGVELIYPRNQWIFHSHTYNQLAVNTSRCSQSEMKRALEGVILLEFSEREQINSNDTLSNTNLTYQEYLEKYRQDLSNTSVCDKKPGIIYANALFDSVLAFAIAINNSLQQVSNTQLANYGIRGPGETSNISHILSMELDDLTFNGASGHINFDSSSHEIFRSTMVDVFVIRNGTVVQKTNRDIQGVFATQEVKIPLAYPITAISLVVVLVLAHTATLILFCSYWKSSSIKATSPVLNLVIFVACYMLDVSILLTALRFSYADVTAFVVYCSLENWLLFIGIELIFSTLLVRLFRIYRIFFYYSKLGKIWSDYALLLFILLFASIAALILTIWMAVDTPHLVRQMVFESITTEPHFNIQLSCRSNYFEFFPIWIILLLIYNGFTMVIVLLLAVHTRKVKVESFKDTKTVNMFIYTTVVCFLFLMIVSLIFEAVNDQVIVFVFRVLALSSVAMSCICFLFLPKIYFAIRPRKSMTMTTQNSSNVNKNAPVHMISSL